MGSARDAERRLIAALMSVVLVVGLIPLPAFASGFTSARAGGIVAQAGEDIASGKCGTCDWVIDADGKLTVSPSEEGGDLSAWDENPPWMTYSTRVKSAVFERGVKARTCKNLLGAPLPRYACYNMVSADLNGLDVSSVRDMSNMLCGCSALTSLTLQGFDTSQVTSMDYLFSGCSHLTELDLSGFDTSNVETMARMFEGCERLTALGITGLDTGKVTSFSYTFYGCYKLPSLDVSALDTSSCENFNYMFGDCYAIETLDLSGFNTSRATSMWGTFSGCRGLTSLDLTSFDTSAVTNMQRMFYGCANLETIYVGDSWTTDSMKDRYGRYDAFRSNNVFTDCASLKGGMGTVYSADHVDADYARVDEVGAPGYFSSVPAFALLYDNGDLVFQRGSAPDASRGSVAQTYDGFEADGSHPWNVGLGYNQDNTTIKRVVFADAVRPASLERWFARCAALESIEGIDKLDTGAATSMAGMFSYCRSLTSLDLSGFDTSSATDMSLMFQWCKGLESLDLRAFDTSNVTSMNSMFDRCEKLASLDISSFDTSRVTDMANMFYACPEVKSFDVSGFDTSKVTSMHGMFWGSDVVSLDLSNFDTRNVTEFGEMFCNCKKLETLDLSSFDTSGVALSDGFRWLFDACEALVEIRFGDGWKPIANEMLSGQALPEGKWVAADGTVHATREAFVNALGGASLSGTWLNDEGTWAKKASATAPEDNPAGQVTGNTGNQSGNTGQPTGAAAGSTGAANTPPAPAKAAPKITAKKTSKTVKAKAAKKKAQTISLGAKSSSDGKLSYKVLKPNKKVKFKAGKATLKKGAKKGTYKIKVRVTSAARDGYAQGHKDFTITFKVK